jgi:hypothetical protein
MNGLVEVFGMGTEILNLARLGKFVIDQEVDNDRASPALHFLMGTFEAIEQEAMKDVTTEEARKSA